MLTSSVVTPLDTASLTADQFFAMIDRWSRDELLDFADKCKHRDDEELVAIFSHWRETAERTNFRRDIAFRDIAKAEMNDRMGLLF